MHLPLSPISLPFNSARIIPGNKLVQKLPNSFPLNFSLVIRGPGLSQVVPLRKPRKTDKIGPNVLLKAVTVFKDLEDRTTVLSLSWMLKPLPISSAGTNEHSSVLFSAKTNRGRREGDGKKKKHRNNLATTPPPLPLFHCPS